MVNRFDVFLVSLEAGDAKNTRPCVVVSPEEMNAHLGHVLIAPISSSSGAHPTRVSIDLLNEEREIVIDQLRAVDKERLVKRIGALDKNEQKTLLDRLQEFFAE